MSKLFGVEDVSFIVDLEKCNGVNALEENGVAGLKDRVTIRVREVTGITGKLPDKLKTWIHQLCLRVISDIEPTFYTHQSLSTPLDLDSLPEKQRPKKFPYRKSGFGEELLSVK